MKSIKKDMAFREMCHSEKTLAGTKLIMKNVNKCV